MLLLNSDLNIKLQQKLPVKFLKINITAHDLKKDQQRRF